MTFRVKKIRRKKRPKITPIVKKGYSHLKKIVPKKSQSQTPENSVTPLVIEERHRYSFVSVFIGTLLVSVGIFFVYSIFSHVYGFVTNFDIKNVVFSFGAELEKDQFGNTNILLVGVGGKTHESPDLTDTQIVASIAPDNTISMLSIPRDLHIRNSGGLRVNELFYNHKMRFIKKEGLSEKEATNKAFEKHLTTIAEVTNTPIQYYVKVDFQSLQKVVDILGGVEVDVEENIYDPYYPDNNWGYEVFSLKKGKQILDGETALKYVRSRKTTSDFDRSKRQQKVIYAIKDTALKNNILTSTSKLESLYNTMLEDIDTNLEWDEMLTLAKVATYIKKDTILSHVIHDDPTQIGGFLYTPEREAYNGAFVLVPYGGDFEFIQKYVNNLFRNREIFYENAQIQILNGTKKPGIAYNTYSFLNRFGFQIEDIGNTENKEIFEKTKIIQKTAGTDVTFNALRTFLDAEIQIDIPNTPEESQESKPLENPEQNTPNNEDTDEVFQPDIIIIIGNDFDRKTVSFPIY